MRILLVDDELELVSALAERLSFRGFDADWVTSGEEAIEKVTEIKYDLAILDVKMPRISGLELRKELEQICPDLKYIFLSGHGSEADYKEGTSGADSYLIKPVKIEDLVEKINIALGI
ncbi:response regulator [Maridesulfovibrio ferrireducens]|uniref:Response regulator receiver domain-containing protein n=1 Tax=Maridesulfovibrio ferrireducens TaxID=246191 RepID=A0A1G9FBQ3_9BACT|nr:response regulator [Maridesulfovibrio ferrireducens]MBI9110920.1 response regulator transcription factor [Maridesulfovibrio ferrireducens]SDK85842.1 Response regulator receiver domain-containing protein [Maridesulfovibrio ferrireducens]